jgi:ADP-heptose:LPS heptosyltransferase
VRRVAVTERVLVLRPGAIGDTLVALPALLALRRAFPAATVEMVGNATALPAIEAAGAIDGWIRFDDPRVTPLFMPSPPAPGDHFARLDVAVAWGRDADGTLRRSFEQRGADRIVVAPSRPPPDAPIHVARHLLASLAPLGIEAGDDISDVPPVALPAEAEAVAAAELRAAGLASRPFVVIHPGSGSPAKNWPADQFALVVDRLASEHGIASVILGGPADAAAITVLRDRNSERADAPASRTLLDRPLLVLAAIIRRSRGFLGNDSGLSHLAGLLGVPTLALFGPSDPAVWTPLGPRVRVLRSASLAALAPDLVLATLLEMVGSGPP